MLLLLLSILRLKPIFVTEAAYPLEMVYVICNQDSCMTKRDGCMILGFRKETEILYIARLAARQKKKNKLDRGLG